MAKIEYRQRTRQRGISEPNPEVGRKRRLSHLHSDTCFFSAARTSVKPNFMVVRRCDAHQDHPALAVPTNWLFVALCRFIFEMSAFMVA
jgi:hypothetical protein